MTPEYLRQTGLSATLAKLGVAARLKDVVGHSKRLFRNIQALRARYLLHRQEARLGHLRRYAYYSWLPADLLLRLGSQVSSRELVALALLGVALSALVRLTRTLGPHIVKIYRAHPVHAALREYRKRNRSASETAEVIDAVTRFEIAAREGEGTLSGRATRQSNTPESTAPYPDALAAGPVVPPGLDAQPAGVAGTRATPGNGEPHREGLVRSGVRRGTRD